MPTGVGGGTLSNPPVKPTDGTVWAFVNGAWQSVTLASLLAGSPLAPSAGGTGISNAGTFTNPANSAITGGGTLALGGFTLTVPASDTAALLGQAQTLTGAKTFSALTKVSNTTVAGNTTGGALNIGDGSTVAANTSIGGGVIFTGTQLVVQRSSASASAILVNSVTAGDIVGVAYGDAGTTQWFFYKDASNRLIYNDAINGVDMMVMTHGTAGVGNVKFQNTTVSTSTSTGSLINSGGLGNAGDIFGGGIINAATAFKVAGTQVVGPRITGYGTPTGGVNQGSFAAGSITLPNLAASVAQLILDLKTHGILGT